MVEDVLRTENAEVATDSTSFVDLVDDHSRLAYSEILPDEKGITCAGFLRRAVANFRSHGIATIECVMTDNAWAYRYSLSAAVRQLSVIPAESAAVSVGRAIGGMCTTKADCTML